jgi:hypothetical protein
VRNCQPRRGGDGYGPFGGDVDDEEDLPLVRLQAHLLAVAILLPKKFPQNELEKKEKKKKSCGDFREGDPWYLDGEFVQRGLRHGFGRPHLFPSPTAEVLPNPWSIFIRWSERRERERRFPCVCLMRQLIGAEVCRDHELMLAVGPVQQWHRLSGCPRPSSRRVRQANVNDLFITWALDSIYGTAKHQSLDLG